VPDFCPEKYTYTIKVSCVLIEHVVGKFSECFTWNRW